MRLRDIHAIFESWAPPAIAWERDNVGLQVGSMNRPVRRILATLDVTDSVVEESKRRACDLIVSHHPLLFHPLKSVDGEERVGRMVERLARHRISVYAAHTNLDFTDSGVSFALAERLKLRSLSVLEQKAGTEKKIVVFVPREHAAAVLKAMTSAGAGSIGNYEGCSFSVEGTGTFTPLHGASPFIGRVGTPERVDEVRLETIVPAWKIAHVVEAIRSAHPYEEVAYDVYERSNASTRYGAGIIGELPGTRSLGTFLGSVRRSLGSRSLRYCGDLRRPVRRVAVCGGQGSSVLPSAIRQRADVLVTADVGYHTFQECDGRIALIDAGHFETEQPIVGTIVRHLKSNPAIRDGGVQVFASRSMRNFVHYR